jgi:HTH-type transcriptional regulator, glycine betaine synthesis regulator
MITLSIKTSKNPMKKPHFAPLSAQEKELTKFFVKMAAILGVQRSVAEIYALLYSSPEALEFDVIQGRLGISKGSVSQGLRFLKGNGMVESIKVKGSRRERWKPSPSLAASLVGLLRNQVLPSLEESKPLLQKLVEEASEQNFSAEVIDRLTRLQRWNSRALELSTFLLPPPEA